jgi:hypothetical protein
MRRKRKSRYGKVKKFQFVTAVMTDVVKSWLVEDLYVDGRNDRVNKRRVSRIGHVEKPGHSND